MWEPALGDAGALIGAVLWNGLACLHNDGLALTGAAPLLDRGHALLPDLSAWSPALINAPTTLLLLAVLATGAWAAPGARGLWLVLLQALLLRPLFFLATVLPDSRPSARPPARDWWKVFNGGCLDKIFSGHAVFALLFLAALAGAGKLSLAWAAALAVAYSLVLVATREHYTVDVLVSWLVVGFLMLLQQRRAEGGQAASFLPISSSKL